mmetsp:Transcript_14027/g.33534  ORF Transcript_14027/g.33534 Transcript_14027/m.33534 type:complete len:213 (+) Transcript_14027:91-729(+)
MLDCSDRRAWRWRPCCSAASRASGRPGPSRRRRPRSAATPARSRVRGGRSRASGSSWTTGPFRIQHAAASITLVLMLACTMVMRCSSRAPIIIGFHSRTILRSRFWASLSTSNRSQPVGFVALLRDTLQARFRATKMANLARDALKSSQPGTTLPFRPVWVTSAATGRGPSSAVQSPSDSGRRLSLWMQEEVAVSGCEAFEAGSSVGTRVEG